MPKQSVGARASSLSWSAHPFDDDKFHEECGVFGIWGTPDAAAHTVLGLHALQHRGQEATGIVSFDSGQFNIHRALGLVGESFDDPRVVQRLSGESAIGHNRYATTGDTILRNVQPLVAELESGGLAMAHNGNLTNCGLLRQTLVRKGAIFQSTTDTEVILHLVATSTHRGLVDRLTDALLQLEGAYSLVALTNKKLIGVRDPAGVRPLVLGRLDKAWTIASETCALDIIGAHFVRDIEPGEMVVIDEAGIRSIFPFVERPRRFCIFEFVYFARPDSVVNGEDVYQVRKRIGAELAKEAPLEADIVVPVPDSGTPAAIGYAEAIGLPFDLGIIRNHYVGRTFIEPTDQIRHLGVKLKHNANRGILKGKRVVLVDDSVVRGTTSTKIVQMVREAGATEVHLRIASPPTTHSCFYGVDTPSRDKLIAANLSNDEIADLIGVDSLQYVSMDGLYRAVGLPNGRDVDNPTHCDACFTGEYPIPLVDREDGRPSAQLSLLADTA